MKHRGKTKKAGKGEICSRAWRPCFSTCKTEVPKLCGKYLLTTAKTNKLFKDKKKVETVIENSDWWQSKQKIAVFLETGGRENQELFQNYSHFRARHCSMSKSKQRAANVYLDTVCPYWCHTHAILTVGNNNPIDTGAAVPTLEEIQGANLIFILPAATHSILLWAARSLYYLLEFWGKKRRSNYPSLFPHLHLRVPLWWQVLLSPNLPREQPKRPANSVSDCSNLATLIPAVPSPFPYTVLLPIPLLTFASCVAHLTIPSSPLLATTTHLPQVL